MIGYVAEVQDEQGWRDIGPLENLVVGVTFRAFYVDRQGRRTPVVYSGQSVFRMICFGTDQSGSRYVQGQTMDGKGNVFISY